MQRLLISVIVVGTFLLASVLAQADTKTFTGMAGTTDWNTAGNWSPNGVPGASDDVTIPSQFSVTNKPFAGLGNINSLNLLGMLTIDTASLTLQTTSTINNLTLTSTEGQYGVLTMNGPTTFSNLVLSPGQVNGNGAATITGPVTASNGSSLGPASVDNQGAITIPTDNAQVTLGNTGFTNDTTGSITVEGNGIIIRGNGPFTNLGSIAKTIGSGTSTFSPGSPFYNNGASASVTANNGTLQLSVVGSSTGGAFNATAGATLQFANVVTLNAGTTFGGSGTMDIIASGVWDVEAPLTVDTTNLAFDGGQGAMIKGNYILTINSTTVTWNSGVLGPSNGQLTLPEGVTMNIGTSGYHGLEMNLDLSGTVNMSADLQLVNPTIKIEKKAHFNILTDNGIHGSGGTINNGGFFEKTGSTGGTSNIDYGGSFNVLTKNTHPVRVNTGTLNFAVSGGTLGGDWTLDSRGTIQFTAGNYALPEGSKFGGDGLLFLGANWNLTGDVSVSTKIFTMGNLSTISGGFDLTLLSKFIALGGERTGVIQNFQPVGTIKIPDENSGVAVSGGTTLTLDACTLDSSAKSFYIFGSVVVQRSAVLLNEAPGIITLGVAKGVATSAIQVMGGTFSNLGTVTLSTSGGANTTQTITGAWTNAGGLVVPNGSTLSVPQGYVNTGATTLPGGTIILGAPMNLEGGTVDGSGSIGGSAGIDETGGNMEAGSSTVPGILDLLVPLTQETGASTTALISGTTPGTQYDVINSTSTVGFAGTLNFQFGNGFTPTPSESFGIVNFTSSTGGFATVNAPTGYTANLNYTATSLNVTFTSGKDISIQPKAATLKVDGMMRFTGTSKVGNSLKWSVQESGGGTVTQTGQYTSPGRPGTYHVVVTSVADKTKSDTATVTVTAPVADKPTLTPQAAQTAAASDVGSTPAVVHNTWTSGAPLPTAVFGPAVAVFKGKIYLVGGYGIGGPISLTQVYNPAKNTWSTGVPLPTSLNQGAAVVVKGILYVIGGSTDGSLTQTNAVWAYSAKTKTWSSKAAMNEARESPGIAVENNIIYAIGGYNNANGELSSVESYNPATNSWTEEAPLLVGEYGLSAGRIGTEIIATDGFEASGAAGDTESYNATGNTWTSLAPDPVVRGYSCAGTIGSRLYVAGGADNQIVAQTTTESFKPSNDTWTTLAAMPQAAFIQGPAVYKGKLYCFGGWAANQQGAELNNLQIYQP